MNKILIAATLVAAASFGSGASRAAESFNQNIVAIFGGGNPNNGWTTSTSVNEDLILGLRGKDRTTGAVPEVADTYGPFAAGVVAPGRATWQYEFSIDVDQHGLNSDSLNTFRFELDVDTDPSIGASYVAIDPLTFFNDNSLGDQNTLNGQGVEPGSASDGLYSKAQNSENIVFAGLNPNVSATWSYKLSAYNISDNSLVATTSIDIIVGDGGGPAPVPEPSTVVGGLALAALASSRVLRKLRK